MMPFKLIKAGVVLLAVIATINTAGHMWNFAAILIITMVVVINVEDIQRDWQDAYTDDITGEDWRSNR
jgi:hypothetical protein